MTAICKMPLLLKALLWLLLASGRVLANQVPRL